MECKKVEREIRLYVGGDLDWQAANDVGSHIAGCASCARLAGEYESSRAWLSEASLDLSDALLTEVKTAVMTKLAVEKAQSWERGRLSRIGLAMAPAGMAWFRSGPALMAALVMLVLGAVALWHYVGRKAPETQTKTEARNDQSGQPVAPSKPTDVARNNVAKPGVLDSGGQTGKRKLPRRAKTAGQEDRTIAKATPASTQDATPSLAPIDFDSDRMLRIEIQTDDPNIRIIWFAPRELDISNP